MHLHRKASILSLAALLATVAFAGAAAVAIDAEYASPTTETSARIDPRFPRLVQETRPLRTSIALLNVDWLSTPEAIQAGLGA